MSYDKGRLASLLREVYEGTILGAVDPNKYRHVMVLGGSGTRISISTSRGTFEGAVEEGRGETLSIVNDGLDAYDAFVDEATKSEEVRDVIGQKALREQLNSLLQETNGQLPAEDLKKIIRSRVMKPLRDSICDWHSYVPVVNLITSTSLRLGDVTFVSAGDVESTATAFVAEQSFGIGNVAYQQEQRQAVMSEIANTCQTACSFAKVKLRAHQGRAAAVAADKALTAINILRAHTHVFHARKDRALFGLPTELSSGLWQTISLSQDETRRFHMKYEQKGTLLPFELNTQKLDHLESKCHLKLLQEILDRPGSERNTFEVAIITAFQALGCAMVAPTVDMRFLGCTIALERMLIADHEQTTTERWSDRLAVAVTEDKSRLHTVIKAAKRLYDLRSRIVHAAYSGVLDEDAQQMERWAYHVLWVGLGRHARFSCHEDFCNDVDPRRIGLAHGLGNSQ